MKHCRTCESCEADPLCMYLKGLEYYRCVIDGHHIEEPFWEKCDKYRRDYGKKVRKRSTIYEVIRKALDVKIN